MKTKKLEELPIKKLKSKLDKLVSEYVRRRDNGICISCGVKRNWKEMQNGHYISRSHQNTRYDLQNCNCQCPKCNVFMSGNYPSYTIQLQKRYGWDIVKDLKCRGDKLKSWKQKELIDMINSYKEKLKALN